MAGLPYTPPANTTMSDVVLASDPVFPSLVPLNAPNATLFSFNNGGDSNPSSSNMLWAGLIRNGTVLRVISGIITTDPITHGNLYASLAFVDITDVPADGEKHNVVVECRPSLGSVRVWIDSVLRGVGTTIDNHSLLGGTWMPASGTGLYTGGFSSNRRRRGYPEGHLRHYKNQYVPIGRYTMPPCNPGKMALFNDLSYHDMGYIDPPCGT